MKQTQRPGQAIALLETDGPAPPLRGFNARVDQVVGPTGLPLTFPVDGPDLYRVEFDDGNSLIAPADHRWLTTHFTNLAVPYHRRRGARRATGWVSTAEIARTLKTSMGTNTHFVAVAPPDPGTWLDAAVHPYVLGVYLGDGDHIHGLITSHYADCDEMADNLRACGELVDIRPYSANDHEHRNCRFLCIRHDLERCPYGHERPRGTRAESARCVHCAAARYRRDAYGEPLPPRVNSSFQRRLRDLDLYKNKHIPDQYFHASLEQRLALLQGVMDTDGTVNRTQGSAVLTLHHERLAKDVHRLIQSVGHKVALKERAWRSRRLNSSGIGWRMSWSAVHPVFRLTRKLELQKMEFDPNGDGKSASPFRRYITGCSLMRS